MEYGLYFQKDSSLRRSTIFNLGRQELLEGR